MSYKSSAGKCKGNEWGDYWKPHNAAFFNELLTRPGFPFLGNDFFGSLGDLFSCHAIDNPSMDSGKLPACLSVCLSVCLCVCLFIFPFIHIFTYISVYLHSPTNHATDIQRWTREIYLPYLFFLSIWLSAQENWPPKFNKSICSTFKVTGHSKIWFFFLGFPHKKQDFFGL